MDTPPDYQWYESTQFACSNRFHVITETHFRFLAVDPPSTVSLSGNVRADSTRTQVRHP